MSKEKKEKFAIINRLKDDAYKEKPISYTVKIGKEKEDPLVKEIKLPTIKVREKQEKSDDIEEENEIKMGYKIKLPEQKRGRKSKQDKLIYESDLQNLAFKLRETQFKISGTLHIKDSDKVSARGWCYLLEGFGTITKDQFNYCQKIINECRKKGYLPIDFTAQDESRSFFNVENLTEDYQSPPDYIIEWLDFVKDIDEKKDDVAFWESQEYYLQIMVEKIDVRNIFHDVCKKYHIPISNAVGWSDMNSRNNLIQRFKEAEEIGLIPVLLYYGDFDPAGIKIAETFRKNLIDLEKATKYSPKNLIIDHFGLTIDFIDNNDILWIDNLITGTGRNLGELYNQYKEGKENVKIYDYEIKYIDQNGIRKCEANAILPIKNKAIEDCEETIQKYLGDNPFETYDEKIKGNRDEVLDLMKETSFKEKIQVLIDEIKNSNQDLI